jgi:hypothetical protein
MCLRRTPKEYIADAALDRAGLDSRLTDGGKVLSLTLRTRSSLQKNYLSASSTHVARMGGKRNAYRLLVGKPERKRPLGRPRRRWVDVKMNLLEIGWGGMNWIGLAQDRDKRSTLVNAVMNIRVP